MEQSITSIASNVTKGRNFSVIRNSSKGTSFKECLIIVIAIPGDSKVKGKGRKEIEEYQDLEEIFRTCVGEDVGNHGGFWGSGDNSKGSGGATGEDRHSVIVRFATRNCVGGNCKASSTDV